MLPCPGDGGDSMATWGISMKIKIAGEPCPPLPAVNQPNRLL